MNPVVAILAVLATFPVLVPSHRLAQTALPSPSRTHEVLAALHRSGTVQRCWNAYLRHAPDAPSVQFRLRVEVSAAGAVTRVVVRDPAPTTLTDCVSSQLRHVSVPPGPTILTVESTYGFAAGVTAPVPGL